jgi:hypothetical protein
LFARATAATFLSRRAISLYSQLSGLVSYQLNHLKL